MLPANLFPGQNGLAAETAPTGIFKHFPYSAAMFYPLLLVLPFLFRKADWTHSFAGSNVTLLAANTYSERT